MESIFFVMLFFCIMFMPRTIQQTSTCVLSTISGGLASSGLLRQSEIILTEMEGNAAHFLKVGLLDSYS